MLTFVLFQVASANPLLQNIATVGLELVIFAIVVAVTWVLGRVVGFLAGRLVARGGGDSVLRQTVVGRALLKSGYTSSSFADALTRWIIYLVGFLLALENLTVPFVTTAVASFLFYLPSLVGAVVIFIVGIIFADWIGELAKRSVSPEIGQVLYVSLIGDGIKMTLYFLVITIALRQLSVDVTILYIIAQAFAWGVAIAVGIAAGIVFGWNLRDRIKNWFPAQSGE